MEIIDLDTLGVSAICLPDFCFKCRLYGESDDWSNSARQLCGLILHLPSCCESLEAFETWTDETIGHQNTLRTSQLLLVSFAMTTLFALCYILIYFFVIKKLRNMSSKLSFSQKFSPLTNRRREEVLNDQLLHHY